MHIVHPIYLTENSGKTEKRKFKETKINGKRVSENVEVNNGDEIYVYATEEMLNGIIIKPVVVFEDDNIIVVNKPVGLEVESEQYNDLTASVNGYLKEKQQKAAAVHRIDRNTSGLVIFAKNKDAYNELLDAFKKRTVDKFYLAMVVGRPIKNEDHLYAYLFKDQKASRVYISDNLKPGYEPIETKYKVVERFEGKTLIEVELITGKTYQIRAHMAHIGYPLVGDGKYGLNQVNKQFQADGQALIAYKICFRFKQGQKLFYLNNKVIKLEKTF